MKSHRIRQDQTVAPLAETVGQEVFDTKVDSNNEWDPASVGQHWAQHAIPRGALPMATKDTGYIPYRGQEPHGVGYSVDEEHEPSFEETYRSYVLASGQPVETELHHSTTNEVLDPLLVRIEKTPVPNLLREFGPNSILFGPNFPQWQMIADKNMHRTSLRIIVKYPIGGAIATGVIATGATSPVTYTIPTAMTLQAIEYAFTTSAVVGSRFQLITIKDPAGNIISTVASSSAQAASSTVNYDFAVGNGTLTGGGANVETPLPPLTLQPGSTITISASGVQAGDSYGPIDISGSSVITGGSRMYIVRHNGSPIETGYIIDAGDAPLDLDTTEAVWATIDPAVTANVIVCVMNMTEIEAPWTELEEHAHSSHKLRDRSGRL